MKSVAQFLLIFTLCFSANLCLAQIEWEEPEVVPEKLSRGNRRVIRFSGRTKPNALVRIRKNQLKLHLDNGKTRWASIPQKNKVQFPLTTNDSGAFSFDLYLPTIAVEIPVQIKSGKKWRTSSLNFRVPSAGKARDFRTMEESFTASDTEVSSIDRNDNYYSRKNDRGQVIQDREGRKAYLDSTVIGWGGLGLSYFDMSIDSTGGGSSVSSSDSAVVFPSFRFGVDWDFTKDVLVKGAIRSTSGTTKNITGGTAPVTGNDFSWLEAQIGAVWFNNLLTFKKGRFGLDLGLQMQQIPFFRERQGFINYAFFDNSTWNLHLGVYYQHTGNKSWNYDLYARYLYTLSTGDAFEMNTSFPLMFEFGGGVKRRITESLSFGIYGQLEYFSMDVKYTNNGVTFESDLSLMLLTVDGRLMVNF